MKAWEEIGFDPQQAQLALRSLPRAAAVFALHGADERAEPYMGRTPNLRGRLERLLVPSAQHPRRLQLAGRVRRIRWHLVGSEFESLVTQFALLTGHYGAERALERMHLRAPVFVRYFGSNRYPRVAVTTRTAARESQWSYGPFPSRAAAERFVDEALKLFDLRRCVEDLKPDPQHPGCVYSEMKMCLAPCYVGCTDARYAEEAASVESFLATRGESRLVVLCAARDEASAELEFERAAELHAQVARVEAVQALAPELVRPQSSLRALILQQSAEPGHVAVFLFDAGRLRGPEHYSTFGMRIQNEQSGSSSLFAQPMMMMPVPEEEAGSQGPGSRDQSSPEGSGQSKSVRPDMTRREARNLLETRLAETLARLAETHGDASAFTRQGHLALLKRWYYRPEVKRVGEIFFPEQDGEWPVKAILRGVGRMAAAGLRG